MDLIRFAGAIALSLFLTTGSAFAADMTLRLHTLVKSPHPYNDMAAYMADEVARRSNATIEIRVFDAGQLGQDPAVIGEVGLGTIDLMVSSTSNAVKQVPEFQVFSMPYLFSGFDDLMSRVGQDSEALKFFRARYAERGLDMQLLALGGSGTRNMSNAIGPVNRLADIEGIKMRTPPSPMMSKTWEALGTLPVSVAWGELYASIQTGVAQGLESSIAGYTGSKLYEVAPYLALTGHEIQANHISMSNRAWNRLSAGQQSMFLDVAQKAVELGIERARFYDGNLVKKLESEHGVTVTRPDVAEFRSRLVALQDQLAADLSLQPAMKALMGR
jgi:tripartite ATP-independent transporter DctP family solute receptor